MNSNHFALFLLIALIASNVGWWVKVRGLNGVISDLKNIRADAKSVKDSAASVANKVAGN